MRRSFLFILTALLLLPISVTTTIDIHDGWYTEARSCSASVPGGAQVDRVEISPSGPISIPSDQILNLNVTVFDSSNTELNVGTAWTKTNGSLQDMGNGWARWAPWSMGEQNVTVCVGEFSDTIEINVMLGAPVSFELTASVENVTADEVVQITPLFSDLFGNSQITYIQESHWTKPAGSSIVVPVDAQPAIWTPGPVGASTISVSHEGWESSVIINVSHGDAVALSISSPTTITSADDDVQLCVGMVDQRGNYWSVNADWSIVDQTAGASLTNYVGICTVFDGNLTGEYVVLAQHLTQGGVVVNSSVQISVEPGRLATISLAGHAVEIRIGEVYSIEPQGYDSGGNPVEVAAWNYSVIGPSQDALTVYPDGTVFEPDVTGLHKIRVSAASRAAEINVEVFAGIPVSLVVSSSEGEELILVTGFSISLQVIGIDSHGNENSSDANWTISAGYGTVDEASTGGVGHYVYTADGIGYVELTATNGDAVGTLIVEVLPGELDRLEVTLPERAAQGETVSFELHGFDLSGNKVSIHPCAATIVTELGEPNCKDGIWTLKLQEHGTQMIVRANIGLASGFGFIDVDRTYFEGVLGSNQQVIMLGTILTIIVIALILVAVFVSLGSRIKAENELFEDVEEDDEAVAEVTPPIPPGLTIGGLPSIAAPTGAPGAMPALAPIVASTPAPPSLSPLQVEADAPPFATAAPPSGATQPSLAPVVAPALAPSALPAATAAAEQPTFDPNAILLASVQPEQEMETVIAEVTEQQLEDDEGEAPMEESEAEQHSQDSTQPKDEVQPSETNNGESPPEGPSGEVTADETWGEMTSDWEGVPQTLSEAAEAQAEVLWEKRLGDGPRGEDEVTLRPLPGTEVGKDGWYFDSENRPTHWTHTDEGGWVETES